MKILLIGLGRWGANHRKTWRSLEVDLLQSDTDPQRAEGAEPFATDFRELLDDADAVDIATPASSHAGLVRECLERGCPVLVEKPITDDPASGLALAELARGRGLLLQVGHVFRFSAAARAVHALLESGEIGSVRAVWARFMSFKRPRSDGGLALSDGVHFVDLVSWLLGRQPQAVTATLRSPLGRGMDDLALMTLDYGDAVAQIEASCLPPVPQRDLHIVGTRGSIVCDFLDDQTPVRVHPDVHRRTDAGVWEAFSKPARAVPAPGEPPLTAELRAFRDACLAGRLDPTAADGFAAAAALSVIECAERSSRSGRTVAIPVTPSGGTR